MRIFQDLTGKQFNYWTVLYKSDKRSTGGGIYWHCKCRCGIEKDVLGQSLKNGRSQSCGCLKKYQGENLTGKKFGRLTVLNMEPQRNKNNEVLWKCQCDCGNICFRTSSNLKKKNQTHNCGCYNKEHTKNLNKKNLIGKKFGKLTVIEELNQRIFGSVVWKCQCDCGKYCEIPTNRLTTGKTKSCGCINYSIGEKNINNILIKNNINFTTQYSETILNGKRFDFAIIKNNIPIRLIEFDGEQHFTDISGIWNSTETLENIQTRDREKNEWAAAHNIPLVRIPYWERDNITLDMLLGDQYLVKGDV